MTEHKLLPILFLCLLLAATPVATAQENNPAESENNNASTSSERSLETQSVPEKWYRSDRISGNPLAGDFVVGPGRVELNIQPGETIVTEVSVTNRISDNRDFRIEVEDVAGSPDGSSALTIVEDAEGPYSLRDYVSFPEDVITLELGERAWIPITITLPPNVEPGGLYGTVLISTVQQSEQVAVDAPRNPIIARVGSHIFLNVLGEKTVAGNTSGLGVLPSQWWYESGPITFGIAYENTGSVHLNPYGEISIKNMFGQEVGFVELDPWFVLPASLRTREVAWNREFLFGRYTAQAQINRGYDDIVDQVDTTFWVLPWKLMTGIFVGVFIFIFVSRLFFRTFEFKRK